MCVRSAHVTLCAWRLCVRAFVWHVAALHFSRNQEPDSISPDLLRSVECDRKTSTIQMCAHMHTCIHNPQRNKATGHTLFPRPAERKEVRAGGHTNGRSACHTHYMKVPFTSTTSEMKWLVMRYVIHSTPSFLIKPVFSLLWKIVTSVFWVQQHFFACGNFKSLPKDNIYKNPWRSFCLLDEFYNGFEALWNSKAGVHWTVV